MPLRVSALRSLPERAVAADVDDRVVDDRSVDDVAGRMVEHLVGAGSPDDVELGGRRGPGHVRAGRLGELHGEDADAARGAEHQDAVAGLDARGLDRELRGRTRDRERRRLRGIDVGGTVGEPVLGGHRELGVGSGGGAEHRVADGEPGDRATPTSTTVPAASPPRTRTFGARSPRNSRAMVGRPVMVCHTLRSTPAASTAKSTSCSPTFGTVDLAQFEDIG